MAVRELGPEAKIKRLEKGGASADGLEVMFDIVTSDDKIHPFWMGGDNLEKFISYVAGLSQHAAGKSGKMQAPPGQETRQVNPIEAVAVGVSRGRTEGELFLSVHLGTFAMTFALSPNELHDLHSLLGRHLRPTEPKKPN